MKKFMKQKNMNEGLTRRSTNGGFTLVETLVAISIFTMSVLTLIVILSQGITNINYAKQKVVAEYLAQEGIEYVKNIRDTNVISATTTSVGWTAFKTQIANCFSVYGCYVDDMNLFNGGSSMTVKNVTVSPCASDGCLVLHYSSSGIYNYDVGGKNSGFTRTIKTTANGNDEIEITSTVSWNQGSGLHSITFSNSLFNWIE